MLIAHMNIVGKEEILTTLTKLEISLKNLGFEVKSGNARDVASQVFNE